MTATGRLIISEMLKTFETSIAIEILRAIGILITSEKLMAIEIMDLIELAESRLEIETAMKVMIMIMIVDHGDFMAVEREVVI